MRKSMMSRSATMLAVLAIAASVFISRTALAREMARIYRDFLETTTPEPSLPRAVV